MIKGCILPWMHMHGTVQGQYKLCCYVSTNDTVGDYTQPISSIFNNEKYKKIRLQFLNGEIPYPCKIGCYDTESLGGESNRQQVNKRFKNLSKLQKFTNSDGSIKNTPIYLDFRFGNKCNFKCRICGPSASSSWFKDARYISNFKNAKKQLEDYYTDNEDFWKYLSDIKKSIKYLYFAGGEPLVMDGHYKLLQWLIDNNKTDVEITYNTNLSTLSYKNFDVFNLWNNFTNISLWPSIDGFKDHCEYGRTNFNWDVFEKNLKKVKQYVDTVSCTVSIYSALTTAELIIYLKSFNINTYLSMLDTPNHLDCRLLPLDIKDLIVKKFLIMKKKIIFNESEEINVSKAISYLQSEIQDKDSLLRKFKQYNMEIDKLNGTSFTTVYPELAQWYEKI